jgi:hypothetical protein
MLFFVPTELKDPQVSNMHIKVWEAMSKIMILTSMENSGIY